VQFIVNCVGDTYVPAAYAVPHRFFDINLTGTLNLLCATNEFGIKRMLYVSSTEIYGQVPVTPAAEGLPIAPVNTYAVSKAAADRLCFTFHKEHGTPVIIARIFNTYGPRETHPYIIPEIISQLSRGNVLQLGNVAAERDFTFVDDTARALALLLCSDLPNGEAANIGSGTVYSVQSLAERLAAIMSVPKIRIELDRRRLRAFDIDHFCADSTRLRNLTGWYPEVDIDAGLNRTVTWFRENGSRWCWETGVNSDDWLPQ
jgi:nucleoside-diphosphate-sugar epimerase